MRCLHGLAYVEFQVVFGVYAFPAVEFYEPVCGEDRVAAVVFQLLVPFPCRLQQIREAIPLRGSAHILRRETEIGEYSFYRFVGFYDLFSCSAFVRDDAEDVVVRMVAKNRIHP